MTSAQDVNTNTTAETTLNATHLILQSIKSLEDELKHGVQVVWAR